MKIQYCSDLHLEFPENKRYIQQNPIAPVADILILAGDIVPFSLMDKHKDFFKYLSDHFKITYWVPGNHEYYSFDLAKKSGLINESIRKNVHLVNNIAMMHSGTRLVFSTLWSKISPENQWQLERSISDFQVIRYNNYRLSAERFNLLHEESLQFITSELEQKTGQHTIVVTHHIPTLMHYPEQFKGNTLNEAFAVELFDLIEAKGPDYWIYGHHHDNTPGFEIGTTWLLTNQLGYVNYGEHLLFDTGKVITI